MSKYIEFIEGEPNPKTSVWDVKLRNNGYIGEIRWYAPWRQYCWLIDELVFSASCLEDLSSFLRNEMNKRKNQSSNRRARK